MNNTMKEIAETKETIAGLERFIRKGKEGNGSMWETRVAALAKWKKHLADLRTEEYR